MQETRRHILDILKENGEATVEDIVKELGERRGSITSVTVRHHLSKLQDDGLVCTPQMRHRSSPGRPQHVFALTEQGVARLPNNYQNLANSLLMHIQKNLPDNQVNVIVEGIAETMADELGNRENGSMRERLNDVVQFLNERGYDAQWKVDDEGFLLYTSNCPYMLVSHSTDLVCQLDMHMISNMLGILPRLRSRIVDGENACVYLIPHKH